MSYEPKDMKPLGVKAPLNLLPAAPLRAIAGVMEHGALKYSPWNWQDDSLAQARIGELLAALLRHTLAASDPSQDDIDEESGLHHLAHAGACVLILLYKLNVDYQPSAFVKKERPLIPVAGQSSGLCPGCGGDGLYHPERKPACKDAEVAKELAKRTFSNVELSSVICPECLQNGLYRPYGDDQVVCNYCGWPLDAEEAENDFPNVCPRCGKIGLYWPGGDDQAVCNYCGWPEPPVDAGEG